MVAQEHGRLQVMQKSLEGERAAIEARAAEEQAALRQRGRDLEAEARRLQDEKRLQAEAAQSAAQKVETDRADFAAHVAASMRAAEAGAARLREEEARLKRVREELADQRAQFEKRRVAAQGDLSASEQARQALAAAREEVAKERLMVERLARDLQVHPLPHILSRPLSSLYLGPYVSSPYLGPYRAPI